MVLWYYDQHVMINDEQATKYVAVLLLLAVATLNWLVLVLKSPPTSISCVCDLVSTTTLSLACPTNEVSSNVVIDSTTDSGQQCGGRPAQGRASSTFDEYYSQAKVSQYVVVEKKSHKCFQQ